MLRYAQSEEGQEHIARMTQAAAQRNTKSDVWRSVYARCNSAAERCRVHPDYHGRGIEFRFLSPAAMTEWILGNLGPPTDQQSLDRIDNNGHYEAGNLRWATRSEQGQNKRRYRGAVYGARIRRLQELTTYSYESIRTFINKGMTDEQIINRQRRPGGRPGLRHNKLWTT